MAMMSDHMHSPVPGLTQDPCGDQEAPAQGPGLEVA